MPRPNNFGRVRRRPRYLAVVIAALAGFGVAAASSIAGGKSFTLRVVKNVHVDNTGLAKAGVPVEDRVNTHEAVVVGPSGYALYTFKGETTRHIICKKTTRKATNCWGFWPPVSVNSAKDISAQPGVTGKLGTFHNHGTLQLTLGGKPLYYFTPDIMSGKKRAARGAELKTFGSTWEIVVPGGAKHGR
jgi:predicted lipoprotein with Yx(FWY)xxD motif